MWNSKRNEKKMGILYKITSADFLEPYFHPLHLDGNALILEKKKIDIYIYILSSEHSIEN